MKITTEQITDALNSLGNTEEEIKQSLISKKITGLKKLASVCPIAKYLKSIFLNAFYFGACKDYILYQEADSESCMRIEISKLISDFIQSVDDDKYPELINS